MARSDAFIAAENFLRSSSEVDRLIGHLKDVSLSQTGESFVNEAGNDGNAKLSLTVVGTKSAADAEVNLVRKLKVWRVASANIKPQNAANIVSLPAQEGPR